MQAQAKHNPQSKDTSIVKECEDISIDSYKSAIFVDGAIYKNDYTVTHILNFPGGLLTQKL